jgi:tRNA A-37 threonylcarbamoyl transferase component Bud32
MSEAVETLHEDLQGLIGGTIADRYRIDELIGVGGMAAVFRGHHMGLKRDVAIKVLHPELTRDTQISQRFDREAHSSSRLDHPNCLQVTDYGSTDEGMKFMVMQLLEGKELTTLLGQPLAPVRAVELVLQIVRGLEHAHEHGVIHRDLKPENVLLTRDHEDREVLKLVDFGIAKIVTGDGSQEAVTRVGLVFGTPQYMSPEQATGMETDARTDLYSAGVILYQMLAGQPPFVSEDPVALLRLQVSSDPPELPPSVPNELSNITGRMLAKQRDERFSSAREVRLALEAVLAKFSGVAVPIEVERSSSIPWAQSSPATVIDQKAVRAGRPARRRLLLTGGVLAAAVLAVGLWQATRSDKDDPGETKAAVIAPAIAWTDGEGATGAGVSPTRLADIDRLLLADNTTEAEKLLEVLRDRFPEDAQLLWREGRLLAKDRRKKSQALAAYGSAIDKDATLLDDRDFYAELSELLGIPKLREEALDIAVRKMGSHGHKFLLELVNREKKALGYEDRHRALDELAKDKKNDELINRKLNVALDLWQANESLTPCQSFLTALDAVLAAPDSYFLNPVDKAPAPEPRKEDEVIVDEADAAKCQEAGDKRAKVLAFLRLQFPEESAGLEGKEEAPPEKKKPTKKPSSKKSSGSKKRKSSTKKKKDCNRFGAVFDKDCWK